MNVINVMFRLRLVIIFVLLVLCSTSCRKSPTPAKLAIQKKSAGSAPSAANVIVVEPPAEVESIAPVAAAVATEPVAEVVNVPHPAFYRTEVMLVAVLLVLFVVSVVVFHSLGRRLRQKSFRAHAPTRHADIWASHKPPQFLDP